MIAADIFRPGQWTDFFLLVGTGAVTLTGLVFVAMSLNVKVIAIDATHRYRAINTLTGLALVFMRCALVLMGAQNHRSIGAELFVVSGISAAVFFKGYTSAIRMSDGLLDYLVRSLGHLGQIRDESSTMVRLNRHLEPTSRPIMTTLPPESPCTGSLGC